MTAEQIYEEVENYCINLILNSKNEDWPTIRDNNIKITIYWGGWDTRKAFKVEMFEHQIKIYEFHIDTRFIEFTKKFRLLRKKYNEINYYMKNKSECDKATKIYNEI